MSKTTYLIFAILFSAFSIIYPAIVLIHHPHGYVICTYLYTALTASCGALCWVGHAFKSNPQRTNTKQNAEIKRLSKENEHLNKLLKEKRWEEFSFSKKIVAENAELQKQVNELKEELEKAYITERANIQAEIADAGTSCHWCKNVTVKDTAKEICEFILKYWQGHDLVECDWLRVAIAEKYGVEMK